MTATDTDLICAIATPPGEGGIGVIRLSGPSAKRVAQSLISVEMRPRRAHYCQFIAADEVLDNGLVLWFPAPHSFTGEDVVELQGHGGPVVQNEIIQVLCRNGARLARPGEFSERAFLNGKIDLVQAEAIADLISAKSKAAAKAAMSSFQGVFSAQVTALGEQLLSLRVAIEAAIDFPDEDVEILEEARLGETLDILVSSTSALLVQAERGRKLAQGTTVALVGKPNVGKSSILNMLSGEDAAIVTDVPGTTRDLLKVDISVGGISLQLVDTAGLRETQNKVEMIGVKRAREQMQRADHVILVVTAEDVVTNQDSFSANEDLEALLRALASEAALELGEVSASNILLLVNKIDLVDPKLLGFQRWPVTYVSAKTGEGLAALTKKLVQLSSGGIEGTLFTARLRHVHALEKTRELLVQAKQGLSSKIGAELVAEDCRMAHQFLGQIVGTVSPHDLLGEIFSSFCIGK